MLGLFEFGEDGLDTREEVGTRVRQAHGARGAREESSSEILLERRNDPGDCRLRDVEIPAPSRETSEAGHAHKKPQCRQAIIHG